MLENYIYDACKRPKGVLGEREAFVSREPAQQLVVIISALLPVVLCSIYNYGSGTVSH